MKGIGTAPLVSVALLSACTEKLDGETWLIRMPEVEANQSRSPQPLRTSHSFDDRLDQAAEFANSDELSGIAPLLKKLSVCRPAKITMIVDQTGLGGPVRYEVKSRAGDQKFKRCAQKLLPQGLTLEVMN